jgi:hypothetical protein
MATAQLSTEARASAAALKCVEDGVWTPLPVAVPDGDLRLRLKDVDPDASRAIKKRRGVMSFHLAGCTGDPVHPEPLAKVAEAMARQVADPRAHGGDAGAAPASFFFHLGDIVYKPEKPKHEQPKEPHAKDPHAKDQSLLYNQHFYAPYRGYARSIFAIAGNHDAKEPKLPDDSEHSAIQHFLQNFCAPQKQPAADNQTHDRPAMPQPHPYWLLQTPLAYIIGLYTNDINGGQLDDPHGEEAPQYDWLVRTLTAIRKAADGRAVLLAVHYPPYSAAANFPQRGDPNLTPKGPREFPPKLKFLATTLRRAYRKSQQYPDAVFSAHAHHYQRLTYTQADGREIPHLIVGSGGHAPLEPLAEACDTKTVGEAPTLPCDALLPKKLKLPAGDRARLVAYNDRDFGFLRVTLNAPKKTLVGEFFAAHSDCPDRAGPPALRDWFVLDLKKHALV